MSRCWPAFAFLLGRPSIRGCSAYGLVLCLPRPCSLRLLLFCTCPPLCAGALGPMPAWVWRDARFLSFFLCRCFLSFVFLGDARRFELSPCNTQRSESDLLIAIS